MLNLILYIILIYYDIPSKLISYLLFCFLGQNPEPVSDHAENRSEIRQTHQNPEPDHRLVPFHVLDSAISTYKITKQIIIFCLTVHQPKDQDLNLVERHKIARKSILGEI